MGVKFEIYAWLQVRHQCGQRGATAYFTRCADIGDRAAAKVLRFKQLAYEQIPIVHESAELREAGSQPLDGARAAHDIGMRRIGQQFVNVVSPERSVALANYNQFVASRNRLLEATINTVAVSLLRLVYCGRAGLSRALQRIVAAVVADNDYLIDQGMGLEIQ